VTDDKQSPEAMRTLDQLTRWLGIVGTVTVVGSLVLHAPFWVTAALFVAPGLVLGLIALAGWMWAQWSARHS
jgi:hypothetical protein